MAILVDKNTNVVVQGITGREGSFHTRLMLEYGTRILAGVTPGKGGSSVHGVPVYDSVQEAIDQHPGINTSIMFVPAPYASDAVYEAIDAGIKTIVVITEHIPVHETMVFVREARRKNVWLIGPNTPGVISPGKSRVGILPGHIFMPGPVGMISRSGTLTYEIAYALTRRGMGQSTAVGIGGDPITGMDFIDVLEVFKKDDETKLVVLVGEIGGDMEERAARYIAETRYPKPVVAYIAGKTAPSEKRMGHAGAIISMGTGLYEDKIRALKEAGVSVAETFLELPELVAKKLKE